MTRKVYKCQICGSRVAVLHQGGGSLSCCGAPLDFLGKSGEPAGQTEPQSLLDLVKVTDRGKSFWQLSKSEKWSLASERLQAWEGDSGGISAW
jgi:desulfoferrodoxin-like iron-binding protein